MRSIKCSIIICKKNIPISFSFNAKLISDLPMTEISLKLHGYGEGHKCENPIVQFLLGVGSNDIGVVRCGRAITNYTIRAIIIIG